MSTEFSANNKKRLFAEKTSKIEKLAAQK